MHNRYLKLRFNKQNEHVDVVSRSNSEKLVAIVQITLQLLVGHHEKIKSIF